MYKRNRKHENERRDGGSEGVIGIDVRVGKESEGGHVEVEMGGRGGRGRRRQSSGVEGGSEGARTGGGQRSAGRNDFGVKARYPTLTAVSKPHEWGGDRRRGVRGSVESSGGGGLSRIEGGWG